MIRLHWLTAITQHLFMQGDRLANIRKGFVPSLALTDAARKTRHLRYNETIFTWI
ncbi:MAG TPA: hypothetical protein VGK82_04860 [Pyrinomonadaceae bacterium]